MLRLLILLSIWIYPLWSDVTMKHTKKDAVILPVPPIQKPHPKPPYYLPNINNGIIVETHTDCSQYVTLLKEKDAYINSLLRELAVLRKEHQERLSERLRKAHEAELKKFDERQHSVKTHNSIIITNKPKP